VNHLESRNSIQTINNSLLLLLGVSNINSRFHRESVIIFIGLRIELLYYSIGEFSIGTGNIHLLTFAVLKKEI